MTAFSLTQTIKDIDSHFELHPISQQTLVGIDQTQLIELFPNHFCHPLVTPAITALQSAAFEAGFDCRLASSYRSFERQQTIWLDKYRGRRVVLNEKDEQIDLTRLTEEQKLSAIARYSAFPGLSRHHWGTDFDVFDISAVSRDELQLISAEYLPGGPCHNLYLWLCENMAKYGFYHPYTPEIAAQKGVAFEPWHISFYPISKHFYQAFSDKTAAVIKHYLNADIQANITQIDSLISQYALNIAKAP
ncbi:M15 family metallopeptidase [Catenovulum sp. SM1970]|uniref:M15 family metallopeptidase n=1 Tax=Marinifaba aquimaris TaxID=2741323 RepID=UPI0015733A50|nr:M15 family metallopeptidase [Marinifaba aquimaris]NTS76032.1 M15 family metallopeptidase [Marinifaba aquimaris]